MCSCADITSAQKHRIERRLREEIESLKNKRAAAQSHELRRELDDLISFFEDRAP